MSASQMASVTENSMTKLYQALPSFSSGQTGGSQEADILSESVKQAQIFTGGGGHGGGGHGLDLIKDYHSTVSQNLLKSAIFREPAACACLKVLK